jgi:integrase
MPVNKAKTPTKDGCAYFFRVSYRDEFNNIKRYVSKKYKTKAEATEAEAIFRSNMKEKNNIPNKMTLADLWDAWMEYQNDKVRISTRVGYKYVKKHFDPIFNIKCVDFNINYFDSWKKKMNEKGMKDVSKNDALKVLKALLHFGIKRYNFDFNQTIMLMEKFKTPNQVQEEKDFYIVEEFDKFISAEDDNRFRLLWKTLYYCGLRIGEARGLQWKDIDWNKKKLWINKQVLSINNYSSSFYIADTKTPKSNRIIPICDDLYDDLLKEYERLKEYVNFNDDFFCFGNDEGLTPLTYAQAQRRKGVIAEKAGMKEIRLHDFRHSCASLLINSGAPVSVVSKYLGHANSTETLNTYSHMFDNALDSVMDVINNIRD